MEAQRARDLEEAQQAHGALKARTAVEFEHVRLTHNESEAATRALFAGVEKLARELDDKHMQAERDLGRDLQRTQQKEDEVFTELRRVDQAISKDLCDLTNKHDVHVARTGQQHVEME